MYLIIVCGLESCTTVAELRSKRSGEGKEFNPKGVRKQDDAENRVASHRGFYNQNKQEKG